MVFFEDINAEESLFKNEDALDLEWVPKILPYREEQQHQIASCIKPLLQNRNGRNIFVYGTPGTGKTAATKWVLRDLEETTDEIIPVYVNCWQKNTTYKITLDLCQQLGYNFTQNKHTEELFNVVKNIINKKKAVFVFDEIDKIEDFDFLYAILNDIFKKSIILITNYPTWIDELEDRVKSRLIPEIMEFKQYSKDEIQKILKQRIEYAFQPNIWEEEALQTIIEKTAELKDIRIGLHLLRESGLIAEDELVRRIKKNHAEKAVERLKGFTINNIDQLQPEEKDLLELAKKNNNSKIGELYKTYQEKWDNISYKKFQRTIDKLERGRFITAKKITGGKDGNTTIIIVEENKKITEF